MTCNNVIFHKLLMALIISFACLNNNVTAGSLTYSPDQWPRHWNAHVIKNKQLNDRQKRNSNNRQSPLRSPMWGIVPAAKQNQRRSQRPEYNTNAHIVNYPGQNIYHTNYYSGANGNGLANPYVSPLLVPGLMPGLTAPGIPFITNPYSGNPYPGGMRAPGYMW